MRHSKGKIHSWYPLYIEKWLWGSMRHELIIEENGFYVDLRGIYMDLLTLSQKDEGFIRANEITPYPHEQLAGMFCVPIERLKQCIEICLREDVHKLEQPSEGIYYIPSWSNYQLSPRHKRRLEEENEDVSANEDNISSSEDTIINKTKLNKTKLNKTKLNKTKYDFDVIWSLYPKRVGRKQAEKYFHSSVVTDKDYQDIQVALKNYRNSDRVTKGDPQFIQNGSTWFNNWRDWITSPEVKLYPCKFCGEMFSAINTHQSGCNKNPENTISNSQATDMLNKLGWEKK